MSDANDMMAVRVDFSTVEDARRVVLSALESLPAAARVRLAGGWLVPASAINGYLADLILKKSSPADGFGVGETSLQMRSGTGRWRGNGHERRRIGEVASANGAGLGAGQADASTANNFSK